VSTKELTMELPDPAAPFSEKLAYYREQHAPPGVRTTHLVGIPSIVVSLPLLVAAPLVGVSLFVGGWTLQVVGHRVFGRNTPALTRGPISYQLTGLAYWCEEMGDIISRVHARRSKAAASSSE